MFTEAQLGPKPRLSPPRRLQGFCSPWNSPRKLCVTPPPSHLHRDRGGDASRQAPGLHTAEPLPVESSVVPGDTQWALPQHVGENTSLSPGGSTSALCSSSQEEMVSPFPLLSPCGDGCDVNKAGTAGGCPATQTPQGGAGSPHPCCPQARCCLGPQPHCTPGVPSSC